MKMGGWTRLGIFLSFIWILMVSFSVYWDFKSATHKHSSMFGLTLCKEKVAPLYSDSGKGFDPDKYLKEKAELTRDWEKEAIAASTPVPGSKGLSKNEEKELEQLEFERRYAKEMVQSNSSRNETTDWDTKLDYPRIFGTVFIPLLLLWGFFFGIRWVSNGFRNEKIGK